MIDLTHYVSPNGQDLYQQWFNRLKDPIAKARIATRLNRLSLGSIGDCKPVGQGVWELRIDHGPGYRVYYAQAQKRLILLLLGADKRRQQQDIEKALDCWADYQRRTP